jgi:membrane-bound lytic murein transglycosylase D
MHVSWTQVFALCRFFLSAWSLSRGRLSQETESPTPSHADTPATAETHTPEDAQPSIQEPEYSLDEEDHATAAELEAVEPPAPIASEPSTEVPPAEALLQLKPLNGTTARFTDLLTPPAEVAQEEAAAQGQESEEATAYNVPIVLDPSVQGHIRFFQRLYSQSL